MQLEAEIRSEPTLRAARFVDDWKTLGRQKTRFEDRNDFASARTIQNQMADMAKSLERDPQLESILRNRRRDLGIPMELGHNIRHSLLDYLGLGRGRGLGL